MSVKAERAVATIRSLGVSPETAQEIADNCEANGASIDLFVEAAKCGVSEDGLLICSKFDRYVSERAIEMLAIDVARRNHMKVIKGILIDILEILS